MISPIKDDKSDKIGIAYQADPTNFYAFAFPLEEAEKLSDMLQENIELLQQG